MTKRATHRYSIREAVLTRQGEGFHTGRRAVFLRFAGCNLWSGREEDRASALCNFCDTNFVGTGGTNGGVYHSAQELTQLCGRLWESHSVVTDPLSEHPQDESPYIVCTGGEPLLQLDELLIQTLQKWGFTVAVETNGTRKAPDGLDWICVSPKLPVEQLVQRSGDELKLVYPQAHLSAADFEDLEFSHFFLQPMDGASAEENRLGVLDYIGEHQHWKMSEQFHKLWNIP
jgi:7-carboxy-7-deazaguanine synthase